MYIYDVENVRSDHGGRLCLENAQNGRFWSNFFWARLKQLLITFCLI